MHWSRTEINTRFNQANNYSPAIGHLSTTAYTWSWMPNWFKILVADSFQWSGERVSYCNDCFSNSFWYFKANNCSKPLKSNCRTAKWIEIHSSFARFLENYFASEPLLSAFYWISFDTFRLNLLTRCFCDFLRLDLHTTCKYGTQLNDINKPFGGQSSPANTKFWLKKLTEKLVKAEKKDCKSYTYTVDVVTKLSIRFVMVPSQKTKTLRRN